MSQFSFSEKNLTCLKSAQANLNKALLSMQSNQNTRFDLSGVESMSHAYAEYFFGGVAIECILKGKSVDFNFPDGCPFERTVFEASMSSLPPAYGGIATVH